MHWQSSDDKDEKGLDWMSNQKDRPRSHLFGSSSGPKVGMRRVTKSGSQVRKESRGIEELIKPMEF